MALLSLQHHMPATWNRKTEEQCQDYKGGGVLVSELLLIIHTSPLRTGNRNTSKQVIKASCHRFIV